MPPDVRILILWPPWDETQGSEICNQCGEKWTKMCSISIVNVQMEYNPIKAASGCCSRPMHKCTLIMEGGPSWVDGLVVALMLLLVVVFLVGQSAVDP